MPLTKVDPALLNSDAQYTGFKNRIINGAMVIDQRNAGVSVTPGSGTTYTIDRWAPALSQASKVTVGQNLNSVALPNGFTKYLGVQSASAYTSLSTDFFGVIQPIEGNNLADMNLGSASGSPFTVSFWVRSSLTGTFNVAFSSQYTANASYAATYTINSANTWEYKTVTMPATSLGTWLTTNGLGMMVWFDIGSGSNFQGTGNTWSSGYTLRASGTQSIVGTSGATFYITGVQLEKGSTATSFDYRPYGTELALCQRYYEKSYDVGQPLGGALAYGWCSQVSSNNSPNEIGGTQFKVTKRSSPTITVYNAVSGASGATYRVSDGASIGITPNYMGQNGWGQAALASGSVNGYYYHFTASAEL